LGHPVVNFALSKTAAGVLLSLVMPVHLMCHAIDWLFLAILIGRLILFLIDDIMKCRGTYRYYTVLRETGCIVYIIVVTISSSCRCVAVAVVVVNFDEELCDCSACLPLRIVVAINLYD